MVMNGEVVGAVTNWQAVAIIVAMLAVHAAWLWVWRRDGRR